MTEQNEELRVLLRRNLELTRENNKLLKKLHRSMLVGSIVRLLWWAVIIGVPVAIYYYIVQPYFNEISKAMYDFRHGVQGAGEQLRHIPLIGDLFANLLGGESATSTRP